MFLFYVSLLSRLFDGVSFQTVTVTAGGVAASASTTDTAAAEPSGKGADAGKGASAGKGAGTDAPGTQDDLQYRRHLRSIFMGACILSRHSLLILTSPLISQPEGPIE